MSNTASTSNTANTANTANSVYIRHVQDEDIYIDCRPVDIKGEVIEEDQNILSSNVNNIILDNITDNFTSDALLNNIGFQSILGITILGILYGIGNYVFKELPKKLIEKKVMQY